jgi:hypothetical protein
MLSGNPFAAQMSRLVEAIKAKPHHAGRGSRKFVFHRGVPSANASASVSKAFSSTVR